MSADTKSLALYMRLCYPVGFFRPGRMSCLSASMGSISQDSTWRSIRPESWLKKNSVPCRCAVRYTHGTLMRTWRRAAVISIVGVEGARPARVTRQSGSAKKSDALLIVCFVVHRSSRTSNLPNVDELFARVRRVLVYASRAQQAGNCMPPTTRFADNSQPSVWLQGAYFTWEPGPLPKLQRYTTLKIATDH